MSVVLEPPSSYKHWSGDARQTDTYFTDWPKPQLREDPEGNWWLEQRSTDDWAPAGYFPRGRTRWQRFWRHWHHGRLMRYPRASVLVFALRDLRASPYVQGTGGAS